MRTELVSRAQGLSIVTDPIVCWYGWNTMFRQAGILWRRTVYLSRACADYVVFWTDSLSLQKIDVGPETQHVLSAESKSSSQRCA